MKKIFKLFLVLIMVISLTACGNASSTVETEELAGGWTLKSDYSTTNISEEEQTMFEDAMNTYTGMLFEPIALIGTQIVSGTNYMFLCKGITVTSEPKSSLKVVIVYKDLEGTAKITKVSDFDVTNYVNQENDNSSNVNLSGGWTTNVANYKNVLSDSDKTMFDNATIELTGVGYEPISVVATQVVAGTNYAVLAYGTTVTSDPITSVYMLTIYKDLSDNSSVTSINQIDLSDFNK